MADAKRDDNQVPALLAMLNTDGLTFVRVKANTSNSNSLKSDDNTTGSDNGPTSAKRDSNRVLNIMATSEVDGTTPVALYANSDGEQLMDSN